MNNSAKIVFCVVLLSALAACAGANDPVPRPVDVIAVGRVTAAVQVGIFHPVDPDQEFGGALYTFQTLVPNGEPGAVIQFVGDARCPAAKASDQLYLVLLNRSPPWYVAEYANAPPHNKWSDILYLSGCTAIDDKMSAGLTNYYNPHWHWKRPPH